MKNNTRHILTIIAVFITAVLVSIPCSVKRDIKQVVHIPVSPVNSPVKPNKGVVCITSVKEKSPKTSVSHKKVLQMQSFLLVSQKPVHGKLQNGFSTRAATISSLSVPIYISHRQFLI